MCDERVSAAMRLLQPFHIAGESTVYVKADDVAVILQHWLDLEEERRIDMNERYHWRVLWRALGSRDLTKESV